MPTLGQKSIIQLDTCHPDLQRLFKEVVKGFDITILEGFRTVERQKQLFAQGRTERGAIVTYADGVNDLSNHQKTDGNGKCLACDVAPWPIEWADEKRFYILAGFTLATAHYLGIDVEWGGFWPGKKRDLPHWQIVR
jgi:peptidoglycan L-alanyl-D-glutamate endopeptidase CwlK